MLYYCLQCKKNTECKNPKVVTTKNGGIMFTSNYAVCGNKKSRFIKEQEAKGRLSMIGNIPIIGSLLI